MIPIGSPPRVDILTVLGLVVTVVPGHVGELKKITSAQSRDRSLSGESHEPKNSPCLHVFPIARLQANLTKRAAAPFPVGPKGVLIFQASLDSPELEYYTSQDKLFRISLYKIS